MLAPAAAASQILYEITLSLLNAMDIVYLVLLFLLLIGLSNLLVRFIPLPLPLLQITVGATLALFPESGVHISLNPELFLLLFIPPLLFSDGWHISKSAFFKEKESILMLALGLVFFTVLGAGYFIHWLIPVIPLPVAFALAAVISPTDAVAISAIAGRLRMPGRLLNILRGESLLNDASGLVAFKFALAAALTGVFVLKDAAVSFVFIAAGGLLVGIVLSTLVSWIRFRLVRWKGDLGSAHIILSLLLPFGSYIVAEHLGFSGILATVAAGIMMNYTTFNRERSLTTRIQSVAIWGMLEMSFNGAVFILLGVQLPDILRKAPLDVIEAQVNSTWMLVYYVLAIMLVLFALRFVWIWASLKVFALRDRALRRSPGPPVTLRLLAVTTIAGVRGAITLAAVLSLPLAMSDGTPFPTRNLVIFLAAGIILLSLIIASIGLPLLLKNLSTPEKSKATIEEEMARVAITNAGIAALKDLMQSDTIQHDKDRDMHLACCQQIIDAYQLRIETLSDNEVSRQAALHISQADKRYRLLAIHSEREALIKLYDSRQISNHTLEILSKDADLREGALSGVNIQHF